MEQYDGFTTKTVGQSYQTVVREFDEARGLWEEVTYNTIDGIDYVESRTPLPNLGITKPTATPNSTTAVPPKPKAVPKPVLSMTPPSTPNAFIDTSATKQDVNTTPGPLGNVNSSPVIQSESEASKPKYIYGYGLKNIAITNTSYDTSGVFVSKPMTVKGNIIELSLLADEEHPLFESISGKASDRMTSVEYYIAYKSNPNMNDWLPILPEDQTDVLCERLFFINSTAKLRFFADLSKQDKTNVYKNGLLMDKAKWCFADKGGSLQLLEARDLTAIYTIDYIPNPVFYNPWILNVKEKGATRKTQTDIFKGGTAANKSITLSQYPFIDYDYINKTKGFNANTDAYRPFNVYLQNGQIAVGGGKNVDSVFPVANSSTGAPFTKNMTDYLKAKDAKLRPYSLDTKNKYSGFEYKQDKNKLIFSETFNLADIAGNESLSHGNATIAVDYEYLETNFRIKIILRKNSGNSVIMSPRINDYQIKFKVMK
jgi:hypothetical protein